MPNTPAFSPSFTRKDVTLHKKETLFKEYFQVDRYTFSHKSFDGQDVGPFTREIFERGHAAVCLPYDPVRNEIILIEQFRPGPFAAEDENCWCIETVAGIIDEGETGQDVAIRESIEEAGCKITKLFKTGLFYPTGGGSSETMECFVGICSTENAGGIHGVEHEAENIRAFAVDFDHALQAALDGKFSNLALVATIQWLALKKSSLDL
ncbi:NUDIX domain-containing protein [Curvivirga sp.]|uniref:NUDIX domain-containing protein n=1 Tax=Curvivirga sp. TaxID=2856848 RepID=UPI003B58E68D